MVSKMQRKSCYHKRCTLRGATLRGKVSGWNYGAHDCSNTQDTGVS